MYRLEPQTDQDIPTNLVGLATLHGHLTVSLPRPVGPGSGGTRPYAFGTGMLQQYVDPCTFHGPLSAVDSPCRAEQISAGLASRY